jgi:hypothetical protein
MADEALILSRGTWFGSMTPPTNLGEGDQGSLSFILGACQNKWRRTVPGAPHAKATPSLEGAAFKIVCLDA